MNTSESKQHWTRHPLVALAVLLAGGAFFYAKSGLFREPARPGEQVAAGQAGSGGHDHGSHGGSAAGATVTGAESHDIFISPERQQLVGVRSVPVITKSLTKEIRAVGKVASDETRVTHIHTKVTGYIEETFVNFVGQSVHHGQPVFTIYSPDLVATQQDYLLALKSRTVLKDSAFPWVSQGSDNLLAAARERLRLWDVTEDEISTIEKTGKFIRALTVYSPATGIVTQRAAYHHGTYVTPEMELYTIVDLSSVWVLGDIYETDLPYMSVGQQALVEFPNGSRPSRAGKVVFLSPFIDPKTHTGQIRMNFTNQDLALKPDTFVNVNVQIRLPARPVVPEDAVLDTGTEQYVFVDKGNGYFEPRAVKRGGEAGGYFVIENGLRPGERVVTGANFLIDSESRLKGALANMRKPESQVSGAKGQASASAQALKIEIVEPMEAKVGSNNVHLVVRNASGNPVDGAEVEMKLFMPQMGSMAPMTSRATLKSAGGGMYLGAIDFPMAWTWQTTFTVRKRGEVLGVVQTNLMAR